MKTPEEKTKDALTFLKGNKTGVLGTVSAEGWPRVSLLFYVSDDEFNIYLMTLSDSRKYTDILKNPKVAFTVASVDTPQTIQIEGTAEIMEPENTEEEHLSHLVELMTANTRFYSPATKLSSGGGAAKLIKITPSWIRWGDFAFSGDKASDAVHYIKQ